jgi:hypothetical protein
VNVHGDKVELFNFRMYVGIAGVPVDLDPRSIYTSRIRPPGPNLLVELDPCMGNILLYWLNIC